MRKHFLDNIRWAVVIIVMLYHVCYLFNTVGVPFPIAEDAGVRAFDTFGYVVYPWFMVILFLIAGISARYTLNKKPSKEFLKDKVVKLLIPSTLGLLLFQWIVGYLNLRSGGALDKMPGFLVYPISVASGIGPLWFIQILFLFSWFLLLVRKLDKNDKFWNFCGKAKIIVLVLFALLIWGSSFLLNMPVVTTYRFGIYLTAYLLGYFVFSHDEVQNQLKKCHLPLLLAAIILGVCFTVSFFGQSFVTTECLTHPLTNAYLWMAVLAILGCSMAWFDKTSKFAAYMTKSSFGMYIVHYLVVQIVCYVLYYYAPWPHAVNYIVGWIAVLIVTPILYEIMRRIPIVRFFVLGIKKKKETKEESK